MADNGLISRGFQKKRRQRSTRDGSEKSTTTTTWTASDGGPFIWLSALPSICPRYATLWIAALRE